MANERLNPLQEQGPSDIADVITDAYHQLREQIVEIRASRPVDIADAKLSYALEKAREAFLGALK